jgi:uncharacterized cupin superfamily protein
MTSTRLNVFDDGPWDMAAEKMKIRGRFLGFPSGAKDLGASVYDLLPGSTGFNLHAHYGMEEMFVVLSGTPTLRTADSEEELKRGDFVFMPRGPDGLHTFTNPTETPARILAFSTLPLPEVVLYPEIGKVSVVTRNPFEPVPEGADRGIVAMFDLPADE